MHLAIFWADFKLLRDTVGITLGCVSRCRTQAGSADPRESMLMEVCGTLVKLPGPPCGTRRNFILEQASLDLFNFINGSTFHF